MRAPLAVWINDGYGHRNVSNQVTDLSFSKTAPGGHRQMQCNINLPLDSFTGLGSADRIYVQDGTLGVTTWEGYTDNPGEKAGPEGGGFDLSAQGGMILAADRAERLIYRDTDLGNWESDPVDVSLAASSQQADVFPRDAGTRSGLPALVLQFPKGTVVPGNAVASMRYKKFEECEMMLGALQFFVDGGSTTGDYEQRVSLLPSTASIEDGLLLESVLAGSSSLTDIGNFVDFVTLQHAKNLDAQFSLRSNNAASVTVPNNDVWLAIGGATGVGVLGQPVTRYGAPSVNPRSGWWTASEVAEDLLGRLLLNACDPAMAEIVPSSFHIDTFAFMEPATAATVLTELLKYEDYDWGIGASRLNGRHQFWFRPWPTQPRYILTDQDQIDLPGSEDTLVNRVAVEWVSARGYDHVTVVGADIRRLGNKNPILNGQVDPTFVGRIKDADRVTLPAGKGSYTNAVQAGTRALVEKNRADVSGTVTVTRPLLDLISGSYVMPWNLEPGCVARLQTKGVDVRITEMSYNDNDVAATLTINRPIPSLEDKLARLR